MERTALLLALLVAAPCLAQDVRLDGGTLPPGAYFLRLEAAGTAQTLRTARIR